ncbi:lipopolysaccharide assembly protein LapB [Borrelia sp. P9F1]|uniref:tetratricopeptide repeat protein n=1 Tax=Borrelia sp. P9F1 TaxID=3058374 RepID=UPI00264994A7|nr:CDC27 family protein [Borrelia sp. P9F1]WKC57835.1 CDC27 family protein [Borrelia sp. P9F1]
MYSFFIIVSSLMVSILLASFFVLTTRATKTRDRESERTKKLIEKALNMLKTNPNEIRALQTLNNYYYDNKDHENGIKYAKKLCQLISENPIGQDIDSLKAFLSYGFYNLERNFNREALEFLKKAYAIKKNDTEVNFYLGIAFLKNGYYREALHYLTKIYKFDKENHQALKYIGIALFHMENYHKAAGIFNNIKKYIQNDVNALLIYAKCLFKLNKDFLALEIADNLRDRDGMLYESLLIESEIHAKNNNLEKLEKNVKEIIKLKPDLPKKIFLELFYKLGELYMECENYQKATEVFIQVERSDAHYKKIGEKLEFSRKLSENLSLRTYLKCSKEKFEKLASEIVVKIYENKFQVREAKTNEVTSQFIDMNFQLANNQWEENLIARFVRTEQEIVGELFLRDLISKTKENKLKGLCIAPALFSSKSKQMVEGRLIDLIEGKKLIQILKKVNISKYH